MSAPIHDQELTRRDVAAMAILGLAGAGIPLWLVAAAGAIGIPSNDDWVYMRGADSLFRTGVLDMPGHTAAAIGQLYLVQPLLWLSGGDRWAYTAFGLGMTLIGVLATYLLARRFVGTGSAVMVALLVLVFPGFARESATFMTDGPTYTLTMLSLLLGTLWLQGGRRSALVASLAMGLVGLSIREFALAAPAAILVAAWVRSRPGDRVWLAGVSGLFAVGSVGVLLIGASAAGRGGLSSPQLLHVALLGPVLTTLAAVLLPAIALGVVSRMKTLTPQHLILGAILVGIPFVLPIPPLVGQLWSPDGLAENALLNGARDPVINDRAWAMSEELALLGGIILVALILRWGQRHLTGVTTPAGAWERALHIARGPAAPMLLFLLAYIGELAVLISLSGYPLDRYLYPMVPVAAILLLWGTQGTFRVGRSQAFSHAALAWLMASSFAIGANSVAYDAARWRAGETAMAMGYDARTVDAGYEWVGFHARGAGNTPWADYGLTWYDDGLAASQPCGVVSNDPLESDGYTLIQVNPSAYRQYLFFGRSEPLYLYGALADGCPSPPAATSP